MSDSILAFLRTPRGQRIAKALAALVLAAGGVGGASLVITGPDGQPTRTIKILSGIDGPDADTKEDDPLSLTPAAQEVRAEAAAAPDKFDLGGDLRGSDSTRAGVLTGPLAAQEAPGCKTAFHNSFSSRGGKRPELVWFHFTAGWNVPGWADLDGLTAYSANRVNQVSWHFSIDREGNCVFNVPLGYKAWTQSNANSTAIGIEMVGRGSEIDYGGIAGRARLARVVAYIVSVYPNIKLRLGGVSNCTPTRSGIVTHWMGGSCSGGHTDIRPYSIDKVIAQINVLLTPTTPARFKVVAFAARRQPRTIITTRPGSVVARLSKRGWTRIYVVRPAA